jgi:CRISPR-associated exonuclease Cas4
MTDPAPDSYPPLSALNDLLFCPRRCALHRLEGLWADTRHTVEGSHAHRHAHADPARSSDEGPFRTVRGMWVVSRRLRVVGVADVVEFRPTTPEGGEVPYPIEYKRGRRRRWDNDDVQLCAQALCLEEMLGVEAPAGAVFNVRSRKRREVRFTPALRRQTEEAAVRLHELLARGVTPPPVPHPKCQQCSVRQICLPDLVADAGGYRRAWRELFVVRSD